MRFLLLVVAATRWLALAGSKALAFHCAGRPILSFVRAEEANSYAATVASTVESLERDRNTVWPNRSILHLPIFPLRKKVRLPTESLTLNLYEERYIQMAEHILQSTEYPGLFGALYATHRPHIVPGGVGPMVPMLEPGDTGVVLLLNEESNGNDDMIPTHGGMLRRRIRLEATATIRFVVVRILENGYSSNNLPFIVAEARLLTDSNDHVHDSLAPATAYSPQLQQLATRTHELLFGSSSPLSGPSSPSFRDWAMELHSFALASAALSDTCFQERLDCLAAFGTHQRISKYDQ
jgi:hypothetical protein